MLRAHLVPHVAPNGLGAVLLRPASAPVPRPPAHSPHVQHIGRREVRRSARHARNEVRVADGRIEADECFDEPALDLCRDGEWHLVEVAHLTVFCVEDDLPLVHHALGLAVDASPVVVWIKLEEDFWTAVYVWAPMPMIWMEAGDVVGFRARSSGMY